MALPTSVRVASLCSGIGGLDLGVSLATLGASRTVLYVERETSAAAILAARMADGSLAPAPIWSDLATIDPGPWRGAVDGVVSGYPCQPFSLAGRRMGGEDPRHLWPHVRRFVEGAKPSWVFLENVRSHLQLGFAEVLADLAYLGLNAEWGLFSAAEVGAPHLRERLFCLAYRDGLRCDLRSHSGPMGPEDRDLELQGHESSLAEAFRRGSPCCPECGGPGVGSCGVVCEPCEGTGIDYGSLAYRDGERLPREREREREQDQRPEQCPRRDEPDGRGGEAAPLGNADDESLEGLEGLGRDNHPHKRHAWPPGPEERDRWRDVLDRDPGLAPALPAVRGVDHGAPGRVERLRALGNGVVPAVAARAFSELFGRTVRNYEETI